MQFFENPPIPARKPSVPKAGGGFLQGVSNMLPTIPSITGGMARSDALSGGSGTQGNIGQVGFAPINFKGTNGGFTTYALIGAAVIGVYLWTRK